MLWADGFFYYPDTQAYDSPTEHGLAFESVRFQSSDGLGLHGWFFPACTQPAGTVLHLHGNGGNMSAAFTQVAWLPAAGWNLLCFDYRGYGQSQGRVSRAGTVRDAHAALDYLLTRPDVSANAIVVFGQSLGGAVGIVLAAQRQEVRGLAVDGAFDHYRRIAYWHLRRNPLLLALGWWVPLLMGDDYNPIDYVGGISPRPILLMQGTRDRVVSPRAAVRLYQAAAQPKELWLIEDADHYEAMTEMHEAVHPRLLAFFERCVSLRTESSC